MEIAYLTIDGMTSDASMRSVRSALTVIRGVAGVAVSLEDRKATVSYNPQKVLPQQFQTAVRVVGCEVNNLMVGAAGSFSTVERSTG